MQKRNLFVYCVKTATLSLAACYTLARLFNLNTLLKEYLFKTKEQKNKRAFLL